MLDTAALEKLLLESSRSVYIDGLGSLQPSYRSAAFSNDGSAIKPPYFGWMFYADATNFRDQEHFKLSVNLMQSFQDGLSTEQSFEIGGLGLFLRASGGYEFIPAHAILQQCQEHYGLATLSLKQSIAVKPEKPALVRHLKKSPRSNKWLLQTAAVLAFIFVANFLIFKVVVKDGSLFTVNQSGLGIFDSLKELSADNEALGSLLEEDMSLDSLEPVKDIPIAASTEHGPLDADLSPTDFVEEITIVVGAFASKDNAEKLLARLIGDGYNAINLGENQSGLTRIGLVYTGNKSENESFVFKVRADVSADAWILN